MIHLNNKKIIFTFFLLLLSFLFMSITSNNKAYAVQYTINNSSEEEVAKTLYDIYGKLYGNKTSMFTLYRNTKGIEKGADINTSYLSRGHLIYGNANTAKDAFSGLRWYDGMGHDRIVGITAFGYFGFYSNGTDFQEEYDTYADTAERKYIDWRNNRNLVTGTSHGSTSGWTALFYPDWNVPWNDDNRVAGVLSANANNGYTMSDVSNLTASWIDALYDNYNTPDEFIPMSFAKKRALSYIIQPPTEKTFGRIIEWHLKGNCLSAGCNNYVYDIYNMKPLGDDFKAERIVFEPIGGVVNVYFEVKFLGTKDISLKSQPLDRYVIETNLGDSVHDEYLSNFEMNWKAGETKKILIAQVNATSLNTGDKITAFAEFNHSVPLSSKDGVRNVLESTYGNNTAEATYVVPAPPTCPLNGYGETRNYSIRVCSSWNSKGQCTGTTCQSHSYTLAHNASLKFDEKRQDLMGLWSSNTKGHLLYKNSTPSATYSKPASNIWRQRITNFNVPGVIDLKRVIRAGRSLQMYGTMTLSITFQSFSSYSDVDSKRDMFIADLLDTLKVRGIKVDEDAGTVSNNLGKEKAPAQLDSSRVKVGNYYLKLVQNSASVNYYGSSSCTRIAVYTKSYTLEVPVVTENDSGLQVTSSNGDLKTASSYLVGSGANDYFIDVDTRNGNHALDFLATMKGSSFDVYFGAVKECNSRAEGFSIQGNIYDDTRVEDITEKEYGKTNFNF